MASQDGQRPRWERVVLDSFAVLIIAMMLAICAQVVLARLDVNPIVRFTQEHFLVGDAITLNSLLDLQWHLLAAVGLLPAALVFLRDGHVRVDFLYGRMPPRGRAAVDLAGHLALAGPFLLVSLPAAWSFMLTSWARGEGSRNDGLDDLFLVKATLPLGLALLALALLVETVRLVHLSAGR